ncbi:unnamed protein product [Cylicostephanus goldi]|uniref:3-hydroxyisobutyryl-coenzyme A hydrolase n=1 Tax=Cylicostephanus goldi TaxID=71465 RepID=A0A3P7MS93_CYLGO|nr:unnamed protein product [Cylicostephanus goldi]
MISVNVRLDDSILFIGINRPSRKNCVNHETAKELVAAFNRFNNNPDVKIGILYGEGNTFCAGYDLSEVSNLDTTSFDEQFPHKYRYMVGKRKRITRYFQPPEEWKAKGPSIMELKKPLIAAVEGYAVAGGLELSLMGKFLQLFFRFM